MDMIAYELSVTANISDKVPPEMRPVWALSGLTAEVGELHELIEKPLRKTGQVEQDSTVYLDEAGDVLWYLVAFIHSMGSNLEEVMKNNMAKLEARREAHAREATVID